MGKKIVLGQATSILWVFPSCRAGTSMNETCQPLNQWLFSAMLLRVGFSGMKVLSDTASVMNLHPLMQTTSSLERPAMYESTVCGLFRHQLHIFPSTSDQSPQALSRFGQAETLVSCTRRSARPYILSIPTFR